MSTSIHNGLVDFGADLSGAADDPMDAAIMRDGYLNALLHSGDSFAQVRVNYQPIASGVANGQDSFETIETSPTAGRWYEVGGSPFGPWPLTLHSTGAPYVVRVRIATAASGTSGPITWRAVLAPLGEALVERDLEADHIWEGAVAASTTPAWLTGDTRGTGNHSTYLVLDATRAAAWTRRVSIWDAVSSGTPRSVEQVLVAVHVFAKTGGTSLPRLHALHAAEYVGT